MRAPEGTFKSFIATLLIGGVLLTIAATIEVLIQRRKYVEPVSDLAIPPGETLQEELIARQMSRPVLADQMGIPLHIVEGVIEHGKPISVGMANQLERVLGISSQMWLRLEKRYREALKRYDSIYRE